jgi:biopolymer transport protein TolR
VPAVASGRRGSGRRSMSEINMVPFIDVMLVLLIIFMVSAPLITTGVVDLPSVGKAQQRTTVAIEVVVGPGNTLRMRTDPNAEPAPVTLDKLAERVREAQRGDTQVPVVISGDRTVRYDRVVGVMDTLQRAGVQRLGLSVKQGG